MVDEREGGKVVCTALRVLTFAAVCDECYGIMALLRASLHTENGANNGEPSREERTK